MFEQLVFPKIFRIVSNSLCNEPSILQLTFKGHEQSVTRRMFYLTGLKMSTYVVIQNCY